MPVSQHIKLAARELCQLINESNEYKDENDLLFILLNTLSPQDKVETLETLCLDESLDNELTYKLFYEIIRTGFLNETIHSKTREIFEKIINKIPPIETPTPTPKKTKEVIVLASQFLSLNHGPTLTCITIASTLSKMGYKPIIISTNEMSFSDKLTTKSSFHGNLVKEFSSHCDILLSDGDTKITPPSHSFPIVRYNNQIFPFFTIHEDFKTKHHTLVESLKEKIISRTPVIAIGSPFLSAEILARFTPVYQLPCNFSIPLTLNCHAMVCRELTEEEKSIQYTPPLIEGRFPYSLRFNPEHIQKKESSDNLIRIVLVGSRLEAEVTQEEIQRMKKIQQEIPNVEFHFVGIAGSENFRIKISDNLKDKSFFFYGFQKNIEKIISLCDYYFNPKRSGGGTSVLEALSLGTPPICYKYGDGYHTAGNYFSFDNDLDVVEFLKENLASIKSREETKKRCHQQYHINTNVIKSISILTRGEMYDMGKN